MKTKDVVRHWLVVVLASAALAASLWIGWRIWVTPVRYEVVDATAGADRRSEDRRFADTSGLGALPLVVPVVLAGLGTWAAFRRSRRGVVSCAAALGIFAVISSFSMGAAYWPAVCLLALAGLAPLPGEPKSPSMRGVA